MASVNPRSTTAATSTSPVDRAFLLLQLVVATGDSVGIRELARRSGMPRSTVSRMIANLADLGMVSRTSDGAVRPGSALATLQPSSQATPLLEDLLRPLLVELVQTFGENAALSIDDGDRLLYLSQVSADHAVSVPNVTRERHQFHLVAPGLVTMAHWSTARLGDALDATLEAATPTSWTDPEKLRHRLEQIRNDGYCWTDQELDVGVNGLAVAVATTITSGTSSVAATISLFGPAYRLNPIERPALSADLATIVGQRCRSLLHES